MAALVNAGMNRLVSGNAGNCWTEGQFGSHEGLSQTVLVS